MVGIVIMGLIGVVISVLKWKIEKIYYKIFIIILKY